MPPIHDLTELVVKTGWRIEARINQKKNGECTVSWNWRLKTHRIKDNGKKYRPYEKGGKITAKDRDEAEHKKATLIGK